MRFREIFLRVVQCFIHLLEAFGLRLQRSFLDVDLRLEVRVVFRLALERDVHLAADVALELIVRLE